ncbi:MAG: hypothetical protein SPK65_02215 [Succinivibrio dextrinosolvens]|nr:hypothetical protein [Succinivibrio dextrinosolvens]
MDRKDQSTEENAKEEAWAMAKGEAAVQNMEVKLMTMELVEAIAVIVICPIVMKTNTAANPADKSSHILARNTVIIMVDAAVIIR